ncbi:hypothetical protein B0H17DRAFT_1155219 [Mycena rosella]|uniref:Uncharacterized protein n=1 Tax=Mycena rosella TaxID=1033263 RepID=A0AAD7AWH9_MYCRO|nr:hypothetical protein B0H17DRAFT_1155219 [Mycena rosella]
MNQYSMRRAYPFKAARIDPVEVGATSAGVSLWLTLARPSGIFARGLSVQRYGAEVSNGARALHPPCVQIGVYRGRGIPTIARKWQVRVGILSQRALIFRTTTWGARACEATILKPCTGCGPSQSEFNRAYTAFSTVIDQSLSSCVELPARSVEVWLCVATRLAQPGDGRLVTARSIFVEACDARLDWAGGGG